MLNKLVKYDIRSTWRDFIGIYLSIILGVIIVSLVFNNIENQVINMIAGFIAFGIVVAVVVVMIINLFKIFNTSVFSKDGYLTMTLPVTSMQIVLSKLTVSTMWIVLTGIVSVIGLSIFAMIITPNSLTVFSEILQHIRLYMDSNSTLALILLILVMVTSCVKEMAKLFLSCSIAHLKQLNRLRIPAGILAYFIFTWLETLIIQIIARVVGNLWTSADEFIYKLETMSDLTSVEQFFQLFNGLMGMCIIYGILLTVAFSMGVVWILNHKLDLD